MSFLINAAVNNNSSSLLIGLMCSLLSCQHAKRLRLAFYAVSFVSSCLS